MKKCCKCGKEKEVACFSKNTKRKDGLSATCKECDSARAKKRYATNRAKILLERRRNPKYSRKLTIENMRGYCSVCAFCDENDPKCLGVCNNIYKDVRLLKLAIKLGDWKLMNNELDKYRFPVICLNCAAKFDEEIIRP